MLEYVPLSLFSEFVVIELFSATSGNDTDAIHSRHSQHSLRSQQSRTSTNSATIPKSWFQDETDIIFGHASFHVDTLKRGLVNVLAFRVCAASYLSYLRNSLIAFTLMNKTIIPTTNYVVLFYASPICSVLYTSHYFTKCSRFHFEQ